MTTYRVKTNLWALSFVIFFLFAASFLLVADTSSLWGIASALIALCILPNVVHYWKLTDEQIRGYDLFFCFFKCKYANVEALRVVKKNGQIDEVLIAHHSDNGSFCSPKSVKDLYDWKEFIDAVNIKVNNLKIEEINRANY